MRTRRAAHIVVVVMVAMVAACRSSAPAPPVAVVGEASGFAGKWLGEYWSADTARRGSIRFELRADGSGARGDVWMYAPPSPLDRMNGASLAPVAEAIPIRFVRLDASGAVRGTLEPYRDPDCGCMLTTTFEGKLRDGRIAGEFSSRDGDLHPVTHGQWEVHRVAPADAP